MGQPFPLPPTVSQVSFAYTSTRSTFVMQVSDVVQLNITFLSPITPNDLKRQSLVFSYLSVDVSSTDGKSHKVQLYTDITAEWISPDRSVVANWDYGVAPASGGDSNGVVYHQIYRETQRLFTETLDQTDYGNWYYATDNAQKMTFQSGPHQYVRANFVDNGVLANCNDTNFRAINDDYPIFGFAHDLGDVGSTLVNALFSIGLAQQEVVQFSGENGNVNVHSLWTSYFPSDQAALAFFHEDYAQSANTSSSLDRKIARDANNAGGFNYVTITSLAFRQAFGTMQLAGTPEQTFLFQKEVSSADNIQTVDVMFPFHPILLYTNPTLMKFMLDPLFTHQESDRYPNKYSMHDLGFRWPNATGHPNGKDQRMPLEECGNMIIMTLAYVQRTEDVAYLYKHYKMLNQLAQYLISEA